MIRIQPSQKELDLLIRGFCEGAFMRGYPATLKLFQNYECNNFSTEGIEPVEIDADIYFEEFPSVRLLKSLNWFTEDEESQSSILYICLKPDGKDYLKVIEKSLVTIRDSQGTPKTFIITNVKSFMSQAVFYICKVVTHTESVKKIEPINTKEVETKKGNFVFLKKDNMR